MESEVEREADFSRIRYAQVWEDADILLEALDVQPDDACISIASAGDNALALLTKGPRRVVAVDLNPAQLACLELRVAAFRTLEHAEVLELIGSRPSARRTPLYQRARGVLSDSARVFWDAKPAEIARGIGHAGKFENYFRLFRTRLMPLIHSRRVIELLLRPRERDARAKFYEGTWSNWRWQALFRLFFSRTIMGAMGRDPRFFRYVEGSVAEKILARTRHALVELAPPENPYLQWILYGEHRTALPCYLREENFATIRRNLDRLQWHLGTVEAFLETAPRGTFSKFNLSDIFEYMSPENYAALLVRLADAARPGARLAYWNMLAPRERPPALADRLRPLQPLAAQLHARDKAFFYSAFRVEELL